MIHDLSFCPNHPRIRDTSTGSGPGEQGSIESRKNTIIESLIPEDGLPLSRRNQLIAATIGVLREGEREDLVNLNALHATLRATSLPNLEKIEADYKARLANAE